MKPPRKSPPSTHTRDCLDIPVYLLKSPHRLPFFRDAWTVFFKGIPNVCVYLDDILVTGKSEQDHLSNLDMVLHRLLEAGFHAQREKCVFQAKEVDYLGYRIDAEGLHPLEDKVKAIMEAPEPQDVSELRSYLGLLNYYG